MWRVHAHQQLAGQLGHGVRRERGPGVMVSTLGRTGVFPYADELAA